MSDLHTDVGQRSEPFLGRICHVFSIPCELNGKFRVAVLISKHAKGDVLFDGQKLSYRQILSTHSIVEAASGPWSTTGFNVLADARR